MATTFSTIPDVAVSKFTLNITGGKQGLLVITGRGRTICGKPRVANENLGAHLGKEHRLCSVLDTSWSKPNPPPPSTDPQSRTLGIRAG